MARIKITAYVTPDVADTLKRLAIVEDRSQSDLMEEAIARRFAGAGQEAAHAVLVARLDVLMRRLAVVEAAQERQFEFLAQSARFFLGLAPDIPGEARESVYARGAERLRQLMTVIASRLEAGRSVWRETVFDRETARQVKSPEPAE